jgi:hypothetical protein
MPGVAPLPLVQCSCTACLPAHCVGYNALIAQRMSCAVHTTLPVPCRWLTAERRCRLALVLCGLLERRLWMPLYLPEAALSSHPPSSERLDVRLTRMSVVS